MTHAQALEKVRKLLRLGKSSNEHEAAAAMRQAQALMRLHQIEEADAGGAEIDPIEDCPSEQRRGKKIPVDVSALSTLIADTFGCSVIMRVYWGVNGWRLEQRFVGPAPRGELSAYAFNVLFRQLSAAKRAHLRRVRNPRNRAARGDHFGLGFVDAVRALLSAWGVSQEERARIDAHLQREYPVVTEVRSQPRSGARSNLPTGNDQSAGRSAGRNAKLHRGVAGERQQQIGGPRA